MEVKLGQSQALTNMNSQNIDLQRIQTQKLQENQQKQTKPKIEQNQEKNLSPEELNKAINDLNKKLNMLNSQLRIETDEDTGIQVIKIIDKETKEVIRQIPPEAVLKVAKYLNEVAGLLFDSKV